MKGVIDMLGKLMGIASIGEALSSFGLARKFVAELAAIIMLTIIGSMLAGFMVIATLYECDQLLTRHGLDADMAALVTAILGLLALGGIAYAILTKIRKIKTLPFKAPSLGGLVGGPVQSLIKGFYHGMTKK